MPNGRWRQLISAIVISISFVLILVQSGCNSSSSTQPVLSADGKVLTSVKLALNWFPDSQHGGFYAAKLHGFYESEGLDVEIMPGGPNAPVMQQLILNRATFAVSNADQIMEASNQESEIFAVMASMQNSPRCIMVHKSLGIENFEGLNREGLKLAIGNGRPYFKYLESKINLTKVNLINYNGRVTEFIRDPNHAQQAYVFSEPFVAKKGGADPQTLMLSDLGYNPYASCIAATKETLDENPELVKKFVRATIKGWQKYLESPETSNKEIQKINPAMDAESLKYGAQSIKQLCVTEDSPLENLGQMTKKRWNELGQQLMEMGRVSKEFSAEECYSLEFLPEPQKPDFGSSESPKTD